MPDYVVTDTMTTYLLHDNRWLATSPVRLHASLYRIDCVTPSADVHYGDFVTTAGSDALFSVVEASGYKTLRVSFTPWNTPFNAFAAWKTHLARAELLKWRCVTDERDPDYLMLLALPASFSVARLTALQSRYADLLIEVV
jgi:hypothetical protein